jgi:hypothetical protein
MRDLALSLTNDTAMIEQDVEDIFNFEKTISLVNKKDFLVFLSSVTYPEIWRSKQISRGRYGISFRDRDPPHSHPHLPQETPLGVSGSGPHSPEPGRVPTFKNPDFGTSGARNPSGFAVPSNPEPITNFRAKIIKVYVNFQSSQKHR